MKRHEYEYLAKQLREIKDELAKIKANQGPTVYGPGIIPDTTKNIPECYFHGNKCKFELIQGVTAGTAFCIYCKRPEYPPTLTVSSEGLTAGTVSISTELPPCPKRDGGTLECVFIADPLPADQKVKHCMYCNGLSIEAKLE